MIYIINFFIKNILIITMVKIGEDYYRDKMKYLLSAKGDNKFRINQKFIKDEEDDIIKDNKKRYFRDAIINYGLNSEFKLCFFLQKMKKKKLNLRRNNNRHI